MLDLELRARVTEEQRKLAPPLNNLDGTPLTLAADGAPLILLLAIPFSLLSPPQPVELSTSFIEKLLSPIILTPVDE